MNWPEDLYAPRPLTAVERIRANPAPFIATAIFGVVCAAGYKYVAALFLIIALLAGAK